MKLSLKQKVGLVTSALCAVGFAGSWAVYSFLERQKDNTQIRLAHVEGIPIDPADLRSDRAPDSENAASKIQDAWALGHSRCLTPYRAFEREFIFESRDGVRRLSHGPDGVLEQLQPVVLCLREAAARPKLDFDRRWEDAPRLSFDFDEVQTGIRILIADAERRDRHGDTAGGTEECIDAARLSSLIAQEPDLFSALASFTCETSLEYELEGALWREGPTPWVLKRIVRTIDAMGPAPSLRHTLRGELVMQRVALQTLNQASLREMVGMAGQMGSLRFSKIPFVRAAYDASLLESWRHLYHLLPKDDSDTSKTKAALIDWERWLMRQTDWSYDYTHVVGFGFQGVVMMEASQLAHRRVLTTLAELLQQRARGEQVTGRLSPTPDHQDPFGKGTLRVRTKPGGIVVYSLGPDGNDQEGRRYESVRFSNSRPNIVAEYPGLKVKFNPVQQGLLLRPPGRQPFGYVDSHPLFARPRSMRH